MSINWLQSIQSSFNGINQIPFGAHNLIANPFDSLESQLQQSLTKSAQMLNNNQSVYGAPVQRPGSSCSLSSNSSEATVVPPIHNKNYQESRYKTELCRHYEETATCPHGLQCLFAHGVQELKPFRGRHRKFKTQLCSAFHSDGFCSYGPRCSYIHSPADIIHPGAAGAAAVDLPKPLFANKSLTPMSGFGFGGQQLDISLNMRPLKAQAMECSPRRLTAFTKMCDI